jgi:5-formyltetrahydrofolate cyclo-ligase
VAGARSSRLKRAKRALRREVLGRRDALGEAERAERSRMIAERVLGLPEIRRARTVMAFWSFGSEVETAWLVARLHAAGVRVVLPRIEGADVVAVAYEPGDAVEGTGFGAMEPSEGAAVEPEDVDAVIAPGVAFDRMGGRVGYGGGFYDRFLPRMRPGVPAIAIAFELQLVDEVPGGGFDRRVDVLVTEDEVIRCRPA